MFISAIIAAHIATGIVTTRNSMKEVDEVFAESFIKYANIDPDQNSKIQKQMQEIRKEHPSIMTWSASSCLTTMKVAVYIGAAIKGFFTLLKSKPDSLTGKEYIKYIRNQHPKIKQGIIS